MKPASQIASELRKNTTAVRLSFSWLGTRKALNQNQKAQAADTFGADKAYLSASQKLFDTKHLAFAKLTALKGDITNYWKLVTLPYTEDGIRLIDKGQIQTFTDAMNLYKDSFDEAVAKLEESLDELKAEAAKRLGSLYNETNYPKSVKEHFDFGWSFPAIDPPEYLATLAPHVYKAEQEKMQARLQEAVTLAENAFLTEFQDLVAALHDRLTPGEGGEKKIFRDSAIGNLGEFFDRFKKLNLGSNDELDKIITEAESLVKGLTPKDLRDSKQLRDDIAADLAKVKGKLDPLIIHQPRRKIIKPNINKESANGQAQKAGNVAISA